MRRLAGGGRRLAALGAAVACACALPAAGAQSSAEPWPRHYGVVGGYVKPDPVRDAAGGVGLLGLYGFEWDAGLSLEPYVLVQQIRRESGGSDRAYGAGLDLALGAPAPGNLLFLIGGGVLHEELGALGTATSAMTTVGLGAYLPFSLRGELWRVEARHHAVANDRHAGRDHTEDVRLSLGVLWTARRPATPLATAPLEPPADTDQDGVAEPMDECPDTPAGVRVGTAGCPELFDADRDGVVDELDRCADTPRWMRPDADGCTPDSDLDGVAETSDRCPDTIPGAKVDGFGCEPVKLGEAEARMVHFDLESSRLVGDGYRLLRRVAERLKARPELRLEIGGHADGTGPAPLNTELSRRRAEQVRDVLLGLGVAAAQLVVRGLGSDRPVASDDMEEGRAANRRVELRELD